MKTIAILLWLGGACTILVQAASRIWSGHANWNRRSTVPAAGRALVPSLLLFVFAGSFSSLSAAIKTWDGGSSAVLPAPRFIAVNLSQ